MDEIYSSNVLNYQCKTVTSTVVTGHRAVLACNSDVVVKDFNKRRTVSQYSMRTPN